VLDAPNAWVGAVNRADRSPQRTRAIILGWSDSTGDRWWKRDARPDPINSSQP